MIAVPDLPTGVDPVLVDACRAAAAGARRAAVTLTRAQREEIAAMGADGTPTMAIDLIVEEAIVDEARRHGVNVLSEEIGFLDHGSARTLVVDPLDGSANAAAGVPLSCFSAALVEDGTPVEALSYWLEGGASSWARAGRPSGARTTGARGLAGSALSLLRPKVGPLGDSTPAWHELCERSARVRILSTSCLEAMLVADGSVDAFADPGSDTHRIVDLVAAMVLVPEAGGWVQDAFGRPLEISTDLTLRYSGVVAASRDLADEISEVIRSKVEAPALD